ncbi:MAG: beta-galactosidase trimerization domain-containing protein [Bryobacterales bacterium]|nr:beta-galactosidase trimerization domain-containing protein [Bryobacterales bacterium]
MKAIALVLLGAWSLPGAELILPGTAFERDQTIDVVYRMPAQATGSGALQVRWTDVFGRVVEDRRIPIQLTDENEIRFPLDLRHAISMRNQVEAHLALDGVNKKGVADHRDDRATASFLAKPDARWWDYAIMMWQPHSAAQAAKLEEAGINGGQFGGRMKKLPDFLLDNDLRWYAENIATDFYSEYHRYRADRPVNYSFLQAKALYKKDPNSLEPFKRHPSFSDAHWRRKIHDRLQDVARFYSPYRPYFYDLGDESGIADLAAFWDFDFSDHSLDAMRRWLKQRYGTLAALNHQWGSQFDDWNLVIPDTTNAAMARADGNYSSWADMKEWMDIAYAGALKMGNDAIREIDPTALVGIAGGQMPGWGGYDYWRITQALTAVEPYDIGNNIEIIRSLKPEMAVMTTSFARGDREKQRVWYELLHGNRGLILWDDRHEYIGRDGTPGPRAAETAPYYNEIRSGLGALLINSRREADPIAIHYSQASMRTEWMIAQKPKGTAWVNRNSATERNDSQFLRLRESWCRLIEDQSLQYNFVAYAQVEQGELSRRGYKVLVLPRSSSLSEAEASQIRAFVEQGGTLLTDAEPGIYDEHSRRLETGRLRDLFSGLAGGPVAEKSVGKGRVVLIGLDLVDYHQQRLMHKEQATWQAVNKLLNQAGVKPRFAALDAAGMPVVGVEVQRFANGGAQLVALMSNPQMRVQELGPPEFRSNERFEKPVKLTLSLPHAMYVTDVRSGKSWGRVKQLPVEMDPFEPSLFLATETEPPRLQVSAPARAARGSVAAIGLGFDGPSALAADVFHVEVTDPAGKAVRYYSKNILARQAAAYNLPLAVNDASGVWKVRVKDAATGQAAGFEMEVY